MAGVPSERRPFLYGLPHTVGHDADARDARAFGTITPTISPYRSDAVCGVRFRHTGARDSGRAAQDVGRMRSRKAAEKLRKISRGRTALVMLSPEARESDEDNSGG
jgi:hypothetical protein